MRRLIVTLTGLGLIAVFATACDVERPTENGVNPTWSTTTKTTTTTRPTTPPRPPTTTVVVVPITTPPPVPTEHHYADGRTVIVTPGIGTTTIMPPPVTTTVAPAPTTTQTLPPPPPSPTATTVVRPAGPTKVGTLSTDGQHVKRCGGAPVRPGNYTNASGARLELKTQGTSNGSPELIVTGVVIPGGSFNDILVVTADVAGDYYGYSTGATIMEGAVNVSYDISTPGKTLIGIIACQS